jgi:hypothetical protein
VNIQDRNVGNLGDIVKHAALVELAALLRARNPGLVRHVETHCFRLVAPLPDPQGWAANAERGSERYRRAELDWVARGRYRCSAGLAADTLGPPVELLLAEAHAETRAALSAALAEERLRATVVDDAHHLPTPSAAVPTLVHVDPFDHPAGYWPVVERVITSGDTVVLAFAYDKVGPISWPVAPGGLQPLGRLDAGRYGLAAWASSEIAGPARNVLAGLGWADAI